MVPIFKNSLVNLLACYVGFTTALPAPTGHDGTSSRPFRLFGVDLTSNLPVEQPWQDHSLRYHPLQQTWIDGDGHYPQQTYGSQSEQQNWQHQPSRLFGFDLPSSQSTTTAPTEAQNSEHQQSLNGEGSTRQSRKRRNKGKQVVEGSASLSHDEDDSNVIEPILPQPYREKRKQATSASRNRRHGKGIETDDTLLNQMGIDPNKVPPTRHHLSEYKFKVIDRKARRVHRFNPEKHGDYHQLGHPENIHDYLYNLRQRVKSGEVSVEEETQITRNILKTVQAMSRMMNSENHEALHIQDRDILFQHLDGNEREALHDCKAGRLKKIRVKPGTNVVSYKKSTYEKIKGRLITKEKMEDLMAKDPTNAAKSIKHNEILRQTRPDQTRTWEEETSSEDV